LFNRQQHHVPGDDRERITSARRAAEALFTPKQQVVKQSVAEVPSSAGQSARKPRILGIAPPQPIRHDEKIKPAVLPEKEIPPTVPRSQFARIRTWVKYGMTVPQVAQVYGIAVGEIERILRNR
jgi:hypothetical protein